MPHIRSSGHRTLVVAQSPYSYLTYYSYGLQLIQVQLDRFTKGLNPYNELSRCFSGAYIHIVLVEFSEEEEFHLQT